MALPNRAGFSRFQFFAKQQQNLEEFNNNLSALLTLRNSSHLQQYQSYQNYLQDVQSNVAKSQQQTIFYINHQPTAEHVQKAMSDKLLQTGLKTTQDITQATNIIKIVTSLKQTNAYEFVILRESINLYAPPQR